jgi:competence protein ComEA
MRTNFAIAAFTLIFGLAAGTLAPAAQSDSHPTLPPGEGRDVMIRVCSGCHSPDQAADQDLDAAGWKKLVDEMASNGANGTEAEFEQIVKYLAASFPPSR